MVYDFRGFEKFMQGRRVEHIPSLVSRICGLCSAAHQVAGLKAIEDALSVQVPRSVDLLRETVVLGEWISSHSLSYFYLTLPDFMGSSGGFFELMKTHPEVAREAYELRKAGQSNRGTAGEKGNPSRLLDHRRVFFSPHGGGVAGS